MAPDWDLIERLAKIGAGLGLTLLGVLQFGKRATAWLSGPRVEKTLRTMFAAEIQQLGEACAQASACATWQREATTRLDALEKHTTDRLDTMELDLAAMVVIVMENASLLEDQVNLLDRVFGIERRTTDRMESMKRILARVESARAKQQLDERRRASGATEERRERPVRANREET